MCVYDKKKLLNIDLIIAFPETVRCFLCYVTLNRRFPVKSAHIIPELLTIKFLAYKKKRPWDVVSVAFPF